MSEHNFFIYIQFKVRDIQSCGKKLNDKNKDSRNYTEEMFGRGFKFFKSACFAVSHLFNLSAISHIFNRKAHKMRRINYISLIYPIILHHNNSLVKAFCSIVLQYSKILT